MSPRICQGQPSGSITRIEGTNRSGRKSLSRIESDRSSTMNICRMILLLRGASVCSALGSKCQPGYNHRTAGEYAQLVAVTKAMFNSWRAVTSGPTTNAASRTSGPEKTDLMSTDQARSPDMPMVVQSRHRFGHALWGCSRGQPDLQNLRSVGQQMLQMPGR